MPSTNADRMLKGIKSIMRKPPRHWVGNGFHVFPVFSDLAFTKEISPFLMFDYAAPENFPPASTPRGVGRHPHRGFETITVAFHGEIQHADSLGNKDIIYEGDVQWMTAGRGIIHEEFFSPEFNKKGGKLEMCQIWLNLPAKHKMTAPSYQAIFAKDIVNVPFSSDPDYGQVRVIAGEYEENKGPAKTFTPVNLWDIQFRKAGKSIEFSVPSGHQTILFVRRGSIAIEDESTDGKSKKLGPQDTALMSKEGNQLKMSALEADASVLLLGGEPIDEPIAARGPFVMNTWEEIQTANKDYMSGILGT